MASEKSGSAVDPDIDVQGAPRRREHPAVVLGLISAGGVTGSLARYRLDEAFPHQPGEWPWATWSINVGGCLLLGVLMALISELEKGQRTLRPLLGVGVLGGFTTFSTAVVEVQQLVGIGAAGTGLAYLGGTVAAALVAVTAGSALTRWSLRLTVRRVSREGEVQ